MFLEAGHLRETFAAAFKLAGVRSLTRMCADVVLEVAGGGEGLAALRVGAHEGAFSRVYSPVDVEVLRGVKTLAAARKLALARAVGDVDLLDVRAEVSREGKRAFAAWVVALVWLVSLLFNAPAFPPRHSMSAAA